MSNAAELATLRKARIAHLETLIADIDHDWKRVPRLAWLTLGAIPVAFWFGLRAAVVAAIVVGCLIGVVYYILGMRREEYRRDRDDIQRDLDASS